jgi:antitoxin component of RelBE/YafQ-DinJ toxin-antitoxin module
MSDSSREDIRRLLKTFGIDADDAISTFLAHVAGDKPVRVRITLEDVTDYVGSPPAEVLKLIVEGEIRR